MKSSIKVLASATVTGVALAGLVAAPVLACTPKGIITKYVQDQTTGSQMVDANTVADALVVHPGDTLVYTIVVANNGGTTNNNLDAMIETVMTDTLPTGVTATTGNANISENIGTINEKSKVTKTYTVKVDASVTDGQVITNKACFTGEATNHDKNQHQAGCDVAIVKANVPTPPSTPTPPTTPTPPSTPQVKADTLPNTGPSDLLLPAGALSGLGYFGNLLRLKRKQR
ncbi:MAG TPA: hypothetical protein VF466_02520 [Candidatus Saccharimonadales bacterium]